MEPGTETSRTTDKFAPRSDAEVVRLILENPLAWIVSCGADDFCATLLPLRPVTDARSRLERLVGHFARSNAHVEVLQRDPRAVILFLGPNGYISPSWIHDRTWAPTWNYASAQFATDIEFFDDEGRLDGLLREMAGAMERGRPHAWSPDEMGERYRSLARRVIGFDARIRERRVKLKLGQDERDPVFRDITVGLRDAGRQDLLRWMKALNPGRPE